MKPPNHSPVPLGVRVWVVVEAFSESKEETTVIRRVTSALIYPEITHVDRVVLDQRGIEVALPKGARRRNPYR